MEDTSKGSGTQKPIKGTLLIVDDEIDFRDVLVEVLSPIADQVLIASNGMEALAHVKAGAVDAVLTDIKMPVMDGLQFLAEVRSLYIQTPVIVLTGHGDLDAAREALRLDATDFVEKPFDRPYLLSAVEKALRYGCGLRQMENEIDTVYSQSNLPADQVAKIKKVKKQILAMRISFSAYANKKNS